MRILSSSLIYLLHLIFVSYVICDPVQLTSSNFDEVMKSNELVLVDFYASWCYYSNLLDPIFNSASASLANIYKEQGKVALAKLDCEREPDISKRFGIRKFPTIKLFRYGEVTKHEYRGARNVDAFVDYINKQMEDTFKYVDSNTQIDKQAGNTNIEVFFKSKASPGYDNFRKVATVLREDCTFYISLNEQNEEHMEHASAEAGVQRFINFQDEGEMKQWLVSQCTQIVRNITFQNAEDITEEGLPLLLLFYHPMHLEIVDQYKIYMKQHFTKERETVNFLYADGEKFSHPLMHLGKTLADLPVLALDSFQHMFVLNKPIEEALKDPSIIKKFIDDNKSGKLHREFHNGPDAVPELPSSPEEIPKPRDINQNVTPVPSVFKKLKPNSNRYTLHDEF